MAHESDQSVHQPGWWIVFAGLALLSAAVTWPAYLNHDDAWYLHMAKVVLHGGTMYRDVIDTNPPLIVFLTMPPAWLAERLGVGAVAAFKAYVFLAQMVSLAVCQRLFDKLDDLSGVVRGLLFAVLVFAVLPFARQGEFGQREHLMVLLTLPYVVAALVWLSGRSIRPGWAVATGIAGGLGFAMKPHYLLAWLAIEATVVMLAGKGRRLRKEMVAAAAAIAAYGLVVLAFVPQYLTLALKVGQVYGGLNASAALLFRLRDAQFWVAGVLLLALFKLPAARRNPALVLFAAWTGFLFAAELQMKAFNYHLYPARVFMLLFFATFGMALTEALPTIADVVRGGRRALGVGLVAVLVISSARYVVEARLPVTSDLVPPLVDLIDKQAPGGRIAVLSMRTLIYPAFPAVNYSNADWSMRHNSLWFLYGLYQREIESGEGPLRAHAPDEMNAVEREFFDQIVSDLCAKPPDLLIVEPPIPRAPAGRRALDLNAYYGQDARYRLMSAAYQPLTTIGGMNVFKRVAPATCSAQAQR